VAAERGTDFFFLDRYPAAARPFYTMPCPDDARYTNSYDVFIRGQEICSGAQRVHEPALLEQQIKAKGCAPAAPAARRVLQPRTAGRGRLCAAARGNPPLRARARARAAEHARAWARGRMPLDPLADYLKAMRHVAPPHAGAGIGLERVVFLYLGSPQTPPPPSPVLTGHVSSFLPY
jgi:aspartyl/asparaginyl-tRNA synthetase